jgi:hypothetical protein
MRIPSLRRRLALAGALALAVVPAVLSAQEPLPVTAPEPAPAPDVSQAQPVPEIAVGRPPQRGDVQKVFVIRHKNAYELSRLFKVFPAAIAYTKDGNTLAVSAPAAVMPAIEETIKRLDVPPPPQRSIEITASIIEASADPSGGPDMPAHLQAVVKQLRQSLDFASYRLLDTLIARTGEGANLKVSGILARRAAAPATEFQTLECREVTIVGDAPARVVRLRGLKYGAKIAVPQSSFLDPDGKNRSYSFTDLGFGTQDVVSLRADQQAVVGKFSVSEKGDALILVLSVRIVD